jgi:spermidine synthase
MNTPRRYELITFALIEGFGVASFELIVAKSISGFFGNSLQIWTSVLGLTMACLAVGYYLGGWVSKRKKYNHLTTYLALIAAVFLVVNTAIAQHLMIAFHSGGYYTGMIFSALVLLSPGLIALAMINPIIIEQAANQSTGTTGKHTGNTYAVSTLAGVVWTLILGLYLLSDYGKSISSVISGFAIFLAVIPILKRNKILFGYKAILPVSVLIISTSIQLNKYFTIPEHKQHIIHYQNDGMMGEMIVMDHLHDKYNRMMYVNAISQSNVRISDYYSLGLYIHRIAAVSSLKPKGSSALIIGMGAGSLVDEFQRLEFDTKVCDIDQRVYDVSTQYFNLDFDRNNFIEDDARHLLRSIDGKFDIIVFDLALGEFQPSHVYTVEAFSSLKRILKDDNSFVFLHYTDRSDHSIAYRSVARTLFEAGFQIKELTPHPNIPDDKVIIAMTGAPRTGTFKHNRINDCCKQSGPVEKLMETSDIDLKDTYILTDDKPLLDVLNTETMMYYRKLSIKELILKMASSDF